MLKFIFAIIIAYGHFGFVLPGSPTAVIFFFIISGFFLGKKYYSKSHTLSDKSKYNERHYTIDHLKTLYPHYLFSLAVMYGYYVVKNVYSLCIGSENSISLGEFLASIYKLIPEVLLLQNTGFFGGGINYPLWQVCALVICGYFLYAILCYNEKLSISIIIPLSILLIQAYLTSEVDIFGIVGPIYIPLIRGFSAMSIGVLAFKLTTTKYYKQLINSKYNIIFSIVAIFSIVSLFYFENLNNIYLITSVIILLDLFNNKSLTNILLNHKCFKYCGELAYTIYLNHALIIILFNDFSDEIEHFFNLINVQYTEVITKILFGLVLITYSIITNIIVKAISSKKAKLKKA